MSDNLKTSERLAQAQKMEALGQLTGGVAHDFNNLLTVVLGSIELAEDSAFQLDEDSATRKRLLRYLGTMRDACVRGASLTQQLLAFSRRQALQPVVVQPASILHESAAMLSKTIRQNINLDVRVPEDLSPIKIDPSQLAMALLNVALNARDAMPDGGTLEVSAHNAHMNGADGLHGWFVAIHVADTGTGISKDDLEKIREPFFTTKPIGKGSGLGLSHADGFCQQSGGSLVIQSALGVGTRVSFYLPVTFEPMPVATAKPLRPESKFPSEGHILVVEDDPAVAEVAVAMLEQGGFRVTYSGLARDALARVADSDEYDLLFSDVMMPGGMMGVQLADEIRKIRPHLPILLTTGYSDEKSGAAIPYPLLTKPYLARDLLEKIHELLVQAKAAHGVKIMETTA